MNLNFQATELLENFNKLSAKQHLRACFTSRKEAAKTLIKPLPRLLAATVFGKGLCNVTEAHLFSGQSTWRTESGPPGNL